MVNNGWHNKIINHDVTKPFPLSDGCIDVCITSPPYWGLRDYGVDGQIGLESHPSEYIEHLVGVAREIRRVLKKSGSFYLNLGDTYFGGGGSSGHTEETMNLGRKTASYNPTAGHTLKLQRTNWLQPKQLMLIPMRVAIALQDDGWILRNDIIWHKPNPMPSSVKDRLNNTFEHVFHFVKSRKYFYDLDNIREPHKSSNKEIDRQYCKEGGKPLIDGYRGHSGGIGFSVDGKNPGDVIQPYAVQPRSKSFIDYRNLPDIKEFSTWLNIWRKQQKITIDKIESDMDSQAPHHWFNGESYPSVDDWKQFKSLYDPPLIYDGVLLTEFTKPSDKINNPSGKNPGDIIEGGAILGESGAIKVPGGKGWTKKIPGGGNACAKDPRWCPPEGKNPGDFWDICTQPFTSYNAELEHFAVFPEELIIKPIKASCPKGGVVLDPFCGRGTVGKVAKDLGLNYVLFDIKPEYCELARLYVGGQKRKLIKYQNKLEFEGT